MAGFECCPGNESLCRAQPVPGTSPCASDPSGAQGATVSLKEWHPSLVLGVPGSSSDAGCWDGACSCREHWQSPLCSSAAPSCGLLFSCTQHFIKASRDHRAISSPIPTLPSPARGENLNLAALECAGAGWEVWAGACVREAHPNPSVQLLCLLCAPAGFPVPEHILVHTDTTNWENKSVRNSVKI